MANVLCVHAHLDPSLWLLNYGTGCDYSTVGEFLIKLKVFVVFQDRVLCVTALALLELALWTRLASNSQRSACLYLSSGIKDVFPHTQCKNFFLSER